MIDTTQPYTVKKTGLDVLTQGDTPMHLFKFGRILLLRKNHCVVLVSAGPKAGKKIDLPLMFPATVDGVTYHVNVPVAMGGATGGKNCAPRSKLAPGVETKITMCKRIFAEMPGADKTAVVARFISEAQCTPAGANTYYITCAKTTVVQAPVASQPKLPKYVLEIMAEKFSPAQVTTIDQHFDMYSNGFSFSNSSKAQFWAEGRMVLSCVKG